MKPNMKFGIGALLAAMLLVSLSVVPGMATEESTWKLPSLEFDNSHEKVIINAELSPMKGNNLESIPIGSIIHHSSDGITTVFTSNGEHYLSAIDKEAKKIATPSAGFVPATYVHQVPSGSDIRTNGDVTKVYDNGTCMLTVINSDPDNTAKDIAPDFTGWIERSEDWSVDELWKFNAYWNTPSPPPSPDADTVDFLFSAICPASGSAIVQPVLEWNNGGTARWTGAAWYDVRGGDYYHSTRIDVSTSDTIRGVLLWNDGQKKWFINFQDLTKGTQTAITTDVIGDTNLAVFTTLEGYRIKNDDYVPGDTTFYSMVFEDSNSNTVDITWNEWIDTSASSYLTGLDVQIFSDNMVKLHTAN